MGRSTYADSQSSPLSTDFRTNRELHWLGQELLSHRHAPRVASGNSVRSGAVFPTNLTLPLAPSTGGHQMCYTILSTSSCGKCRLNLKELAMRNPLLTLVVSVIALALVTFQPGIVNAQEMTAIEAGDAMPICVALNSYNPPRAERSDQASHEPRSSRVLWSMHN